MMEPISPELVLVDPDLATRVRAAPIERPPPALERTLGHDAVAEPAGHTDIRAGSTRAFKRLGALLLGTGLLVSGLLAAAAVSGTNSEPQPLSPPDGGAALAPEVVKRPTTVRTVRRQRAAPARERRCELGQRRSRSRRAAGREPAQQRGRRNAAGKHQREPRQLKRALPSNGSSSP